MVLFAVMRNSDMTEGRGLMVMESLWFSREKAVEYMNKQPGIMGRKPRSGSWETEKWAGDWRIKPITTLDELEKKANESAK